MSKEEIKKILDPKDSGLDNTLRPSRMDDFLGQHSLKENLRILIDAHIKRGDSLEHVLFYGPPGLGKTTLANILASEMGVQIRVTSGPAIERAGDLVSILTNVQEGDIVFIDEIHRLNKTVEEILYPAMEDRALDIILGKGPSARTLRLELPKFTLVGATTRVGLLSAPLRDRFGAHYKLSLYEASDIEKIIERSAKIMEIEIDHSASANLSGRSRGTPRLANRLLRRVRDYADYMGKKSVTNEIVDEALNKLGIDEKGLNSEDTKLIELIIDKFEGGPVGLSTLCAALSEDATSLEEVVEPYLLQLGLIKRTPKGRVATNRAYEHFGLRKVLDEKLPL